MPVLILDYGWNGVSVEAITLPYHCLRVDMFILRSSVITLKFCPATEAGPAFVLIPTISPAVNAGKAVSLPLKTTGS